MGDTAMTRPDHPRLARTTLFVPASRPEMIPKAAISAADAVCIDLEDSVVPDEKAASRAHVVHALRSLDFGARTRIVRINGLDTSYAYRDLVEVVEAAGERLDLVMLPKVGSARDVVFVDMLLSQIEAQMRLGRPIGIEAQIESAQGFVYLREIASASPRLEALIFGPGDYAASMRMPASGIGELDANDELYPGHRWHAAMHGIVAAARAHGLRCMDGPYSAYKDAAGFERSCRIARAMGFDGKQCIHPGQLEMARALFSPSEDEVTRAAAVVAAFDAAVAAGHGAASHDGRMIDAASLRMARTTLDRVEQEKHEKQEKQEKQQKRDKQEKARPASKK
jgi:citrate lyase subunit beta/citryl-CoA lyase